MTISALLLAFILPITVQAATPRQGYVVLVNGRKIYLDHSLKSGAQAGQRFQVYVEGDVLRHPVTKASLGRTEDTVLAEGVIEKVQPKYSVGRLSGTAIDVKVGSRARLLPLGAAAAVPAPTAAAPAAHPVAAPPMPRSIPVQAPVIPVVQRGPDGSDKVTFIHAKSPRWRSGVFDFRIRAMAVADFDADGKLDLALADENRVYLYAYPPVQTKARAEWKYSGITIEIMSLEAGDVNGNGRAELFVTAYNKSFPRMETTVLEVGKNGKWSQTAETPYMVRSYQGENGKRLLAVQQLTEDKTFPFSSIFNLALDDGKYRRGKDRIRFRRVNWLYNFTTVDIDGSGNKPLYNLKNDRLRLDLKKGAWRSQEPFGRTPVRMQWSGRMLMFRPPVLVRYEGKKASIQLVRNLARFGGLAHSFGMYARSELERRDWTGLGFETIWKATVDGYCPAQTLVPVQGGGHELAASVVATTGQSAVMVFEP